MGRHITNEYTMPNPGRRRASQVAPAPVPEGPVVSSGKVVHALSAGLLATVLTVLIVAADRLVDLWWNGGLLLAMAVLWLAVFVGLTLFARVTSRLAIRLATAFDAWSERVAREQAADDLMASREHQP